MLYVILLSLLMILLPTCKCDQASDLWQQLEWLLNLNLILKDTVNCGRKWLISMLEKLNLLCLTSLITLVPLMQKWMSLFLRKNNLLRCWGCLSRLFHLSYSITSSSITLLFLHYLYYLNCQQESLILDLFYQAFYSEVALYVYKRTIQPCKEWCCYVWADARSCYLVLLDKLQKQIYRTVGPSLAAPLKTLAHCRIVAVKAFSTGITWWMFIWTGSNGSSSLFLREIYLFFW